MREREGEGGERCSRRQRKCRRGGGEGGGTSREEERIRMNEEFQSYSYCKGNETVAGEGPG